MSHDRGRRDGCFSSRHDGRGRWLWRLVRRLDDFDVIEAVYMKNNRALPESRIQGPENDRRCCKQESEANRDQGGTEKDADD